MTSIYFSRFLLTLLWLTPAIRSLNFISRIPTCPSSESVRSRLLMSIESPANKLPVSPFQFRQTVARTLASSAKGASILAATAAAAILYRPSIAKAATSMEAANVKLSSYGLPPVLFETPGFSTVVAEYGRGNSKDGFVGIEPVVLQFSYPQSWLLSTTKMDVNGEAGTVSANDYVKGDSAFYFGSKLASGEALNFDNIASNRPLLLKLARSALTQKGDMMDSLALGDVQEGPRGTDGQRYIIADISYELNTEAGFLVGRRATLSATQIGDKLHSLTAATTQKRFTNLRDALREVARSFRVYRISTGFFSSNGN